MNTPGTLKWVTATIGAKNSRQYRDVNARTKKVMLKGAEPRYGAGGVVSSKDAFLRSPGL